MCSVVSPYNIEKMHTCKILEGKKRLVSLEVGLFQAEL